MNIVTKSSQQKRKCNWCKKRFKPRVAGRPALFCSASCRQRAYERRKWTPHSASDALALDLLSPAARRKMIAEVRHIYMLELLWDGTVPLRDVAQIDGVLDPLKPPMRMVWLRRLEEGRRKDDQALSIIAQWRLSRQQPHGE
jgi:hypothetical protein